MFAIINSDSYERFYAIRALPSNVNFYSVRDALQKFADSDHPQKYDAMHKLVEIDKRNHHWTEDPDDSNASV